MTGWADLHLHTTCSDGADTPERVMKRAHELGIAGSAALQPDDGLDQRAFTTAGFADDP